MSGLKDNALLSLLRVGAASVGELERRGSPELEQNVHLVSFVDVNAGLLASTDLYTG